MTNTAAIILIVVSFWAVAAVWGQIVLNRSRRRAFEATERARKAIRDAAQAIGTAP